MESKFQREINNTILLKKKLLALEIQVSEAINKISKTIKNNKKVLICGNGGSAADAQHLAAEFLVRLRPKVNRKPFPVITLAQDTSTITACGNDLGFENLFLRTFEGIAHKGDLLIVFSTSGNSKNIIKVLNYAKSKNFNSISFLGNKGGKSKGLSKLDIIVPEKNTARIQECHIFLGHYIFQKVEDILIKKEKK